MVRAIPRHRRLRCQLCGDPGTRDAPISGNGYCPSCGLGRSVAQQLGAKITGCTRVLDCPDHDHADALAEVDRQMILYRL